MSTAVVPPRFIRPPLFTVDDIPVFSETDRYIENYLKISSDHLAAMRPGQDNPFIEDELWVRLEASTRTLIDKYVADRARVLDVGVGLGRVLGPLQRLQRYGIDISHAYLRKVRDQGIVPAFAR